jgi:Putative methyltransferase.
MSSGREWLHPHLGNENDDDSSTSSVDSNDTLQDMIQFKSHRNNTGLEEAISIRYPLPSSAVQPGTLRLSTLLQENDLVPLFDGAGWAGTRVWAAAIWGLKYLIDNYSERNMTLCELGCGLGVPGMVWHQLGRDVVLTDQESIMTQLVENAKSNFMNSYMNRPSEKETGNLGKLFVQPLTWSRKGVHTLLDSTGFCNGFDIVLNCDCVYEPLYGKSWELLVEVIDECLRVNPKCIVVTSAERRNADGIELFVQRMKESAYVGSVEKVMADSSRNLELYVTRGIVNT